MKIDKLYEVLSKHIRDLDNPIFLKWKGKYGCELTHVSISGIEFASIFLTLYMYNDYGSPVPYYIHRKNLRKFLKGEPMEDGTYLCGKGLSKVQELLDVEEQDLYDLHELHSKKEKYTIGRMVSAVEELKRLSKSLEGTISFSDKIFQIEEKLQDEMLKYSLLLDKECIYNRIYSGEKRHCKVIALSHFTDQGYLVVKVEYPGNKNTESACLYNLIFK